MDLTHQINYLPSAQQDLLEIIEYISKDDAHAAHAFVDKWDATISNLAAFPFLGLIPNDRRLHSLKFRMVVIQN
jgi:plasmid stabilization system protein ParE